MIFMKSVVISKNEYSKLKKQADAYKRLSSRLFESLIKDPIEEIMNDFRRADLYTNEFLADLEKGLRKSSFAKK